MKEGVGEIPIIIQPRWVGWGVLVSLIGVVLGDGERIWVRIVRIAMFSKPSEGNWLTGSDGVVLFSPAR